VLDKRGEKKERKEKIESQGYANEGICAEKI
jgi:hypothetical protein